MKLYTCKALGAVTLMAGLTTACEPNEADKINLGPLPDFAKVEVLTTPSEENPNVIQFAVQTEENYNIAWLVYESNGAQSFVKGATFEKSYTWIGEYKVDLLLYNRAGQVQKTYEVDIEQNNPDIYEDVNMVNLTGGLTQKSWVWDPAEAGHLGCGPEGGTYPEWWSVGANELEGKQIYDDVLTFELNAEQVYKLAVNDSIFSNETLLNYFDPVTYPEAQTVAAPVKYEQPEGQSWSLSQDGEQLYLSFSEGAFPSYPAAESALGGKYKVTKLTEDQLHLVWQGPGIHWYYTFKAVK